ncbi:MAG: hypothetical protein GC200_03330 [Tepidisphaera sp.]|nr:hypothetical protein [Tepidisphaera sp.]
MTDDATDLPRQMNQLQDQVRTLQEHAAFADHADESLKAQLVEVDRAVRALAQRLIALEARLAGLVEPKAEDDAE